MPFLTQPSQFILAWDRHQICWLAYPVAWFVVTINRLLTYDAIQLNSKQTLSLQRDVMCIYHLGRTLQRVKIFSVQRRYQHYKYQGTLSSKKCVDSKKNRQYLLTATWFSIIDHLTTVLLPHPFNSLFYRTTWVSQHRKGKPF